MKNPFIINDSCLLIDRHPMLKPKRIIIKFPNNPNNNNYNVVENPTEIVPHNMNIDGFNNSHGSFWFRGRLLGRGGFGSVFLAQVNRDFFANSHSRKFLSGAHIAVKSSFLKDSSSLRFEKKVLDDLKSSSNVVQCYGHEITKSLSGKLVYNLLLEYCSGGTLRDRISKFGPCGLSELEVRRYTRDIVYGIDSIHGCGYIHCDIKPENILLIPNFNYGGCLVAKIADFGLAMVMTNVVNIDDDDIRGTESYIAPESLRDSYIDWPVDIWALGCVVFEMLTGKQVWNNSKKFDPEMLTYLDHNNEWSEILHELSPMAIDFLRRCLIRNPYKRLSAKLLLHHPFINDFGSHK